MAKTFEDRHPSKVMNILISMGQILLIEFGQNRSQNFEFFK